MYKIRGKITFSCCLYSFLFYFRYDSNNIVLIEENGNPTGNRVNAPLPNVIRPMLQKVLYVQNVVTHLI